MPSLKTSSGKSERCPLGSRLRGATPIDQHGWLLLPGAFLVPVSPQLLAPFMFVNFAFAAFF